ncbi:hypothetical protein FRB95_007006 [Tulasnella sp. JGI-2019a]|nr:hypothetical protein FRB95_007006 [Tulasnella sp. JGI-2019a]
MMHGGISARQRALKTPEILLSVFQRLEVNDLNELAQVCKIWSPIAIDIKWRTSRIQLSRVLARLAPFTAVKSQDDTIRSFERTDITKEQWDRFQNEYAGKVTELDIDVSLASVSRCAVEKLVQAHGGLLFPTLRKLRIDPTFPPDREDWWTPMAALVACPTLRSVEIAQGDSDDEDMDGIIDAITAMAPHINDVSIETPEYCPTYTAFSEVTQLTVTGYFDHEAWMACASLPKLESLTLLEAPSIIYYDHDVRWKQTYTVTFATLKTLRIDDGYEGRQAMFIVSIFRNATMPLLQTIDLYCTRDIDMALIRRYLARGSPLLREINLNGEEEKGPIGIVDVEDEDEGSEDEGEVDEDSGGDY